MAVESNKAITSVLVLVGFFLELLTSRPSTSTSKSERGELQRGREATERATKSRGLQKGIPTRKKNFLKDF